LADANIRLGEIEGLTPEERANIEQEFGDVIDQLGQSIDTLVESAQ
jgi:hypothetical protein